MRAQLSKRVERLAKRLLPSAAPTCVCCGGPQPGYNCMAYLNDANQFLFGQCPACGLALGDDGRPLHPERWDGKSPRPMKLYGRVVYEITKDWDAVTDGRANQGRPGNAAEPKQRRARHACSSGSLKKQGQRARKGREKGQA